MTMQHKSLGDRMKDYEKASVSLLSPRLPVILCVDGKAFHTFTKKCEKPFDRQFNLAMNQVAIDLCKTIQGAEMAYVQSDEVSVLIHPYKRFTSQGWFNNKVQKMCSVAAARAAVTMTMQSTKIFGHYRDALFDARVFIVPENDVSNYFLWRQRDAERNSTQMIGYHTFGHKAIMGKCMQDVREDLVKAKVSLDDFFETGAFSGRLILRQLGHSADKPNRSVVNDWCAINARKCDWQQIVESKLKTED